MKKVSIVIGCYNDEQYIERAIISALNQDYSSVEVIVIDDGSKDGSREIIEKYDGKVVPIYKENGGQRSVYNIGYSLSNGDYIVFLDSDDFLENSAITQCIEIAQDCNNVSKIQYKLRLADENGVYLNGCTPGLLDGKNARSMLIDHGILYYSSPGSGNMYSRDCLKKFFPLPISEKDRHGADFFLIVAAAFSGEILSIQNPLGGYTLRNFSKNKQSAIFGNSAVTYGGVIDSSREIEGLSWVAGIFPELSIKVKKIKNISMEKALFGGLALSDKISYAQFLSAYLGFSKYVVIDPWRGWVGKMALLCWGGVLVLTPRFFRLPLVRVVCNQAARV